VFETLTALDVLLALGMGATGVVAGGAVARLPFVRGDRARAGVALLGSTMLALAAALAMLRLVVVAVSWPLLGTEFVLDQSFTLPLTVLPVLLAARLAGPRLRRLSADAEELPAIATASPALSVPVLLAGLGSALGIYLWAVPPRPPYGRDVLALGLAALGAALVTVWHAERVRHRALTAQHQFRSASVVLPAIVLAAFLGSFVGLGEVTPAASADAPDREQARDSVHGDLVLGQRWVWQDSRLVEAETVNGAAVAAPTLQAAPGERLHVVNRSYRTWIVEAGEDRLLVEPGESLSVRP